MDFVLAISGFFTEHWLLLAFLAPMFWAAVNLLDVYFVDGVYRDEFDGLIISSFFQILPIAVVLLFLRIDFGSFVGFSYSDGVIGLDKFLWLALAGGLAFNFSFYFYYKALFNTNDSALLQIFWGLTIVVVPVLSFLLWGERLSLYIYLGMAITLLGVTILSASKKFQAKIFSRYSLIMVGAVFFLSLAMVLEGKAYESLAGRGLGDQGFLLGFLFFALGAFLSGLIFSIIKKRNPWPLLKKYWKVFILLEGMTSLGNFTSQRAIDVSPSVSYVATAETFVPVFILGFSLLVLFFSSNLLKIKSLVIERVYGGQLNGVWLKIVATLIMAFGVYIMS